MTHLIVAVLAMAVPAIAGSADTVWRWTDESGVVHYSNVATRVPAAATPVTTRIIREVDRLPGHTPALVHGVVVDDGEAGGDFSPPLPRPARARLTPTYDTDRRRFGCYATQVLSAGGWAHPEDITWAGNCDPFFYGVGSWLHSARAELALRANGIDVRQLYQRYRRTLAAAPAED